MSKRQLVRIDGVFAIPGRGLALVPSIPRDQTPSGTIAVTLRRPDGSTLSARATIADPFVTPPPARPLGGTKCIVLLDVTLDESPVGTEVWTTA